MSSDIIIGLLVNCMNLVLYSFRPIVSPIFDAAFESARKASLTELIFQPTISIPSAYARILIDLL